MDGFGDVIWDGDDFIYRVLRSVDGGLTWNVTGSAINGHPKRFFPGKLGELAGHTQGGYNLCVGASLFDPNLVAVGVGTPFLSKDGGNHWILLNGGAHLHADIHAVVFDPTDSAHLRLDVCSDGGLTTTPDLDGSFSSAGNRQLPNFQFTRFAPSPHDIGLLAGSLQDNGTVYASLYVNSGPWRDLDGGDGGLAMFLQTRQLVRHNNTLQLDVGGTPVEYGSQARAAEWTDAKREMRDLKLFPAPPLAWGVIPVDGTVDGLHADHGEDDGHFVTETVTTPIWRDAASELLLAVAGRGETIFGLFAADGGPLHWRMLGTVPHQPDKDKDGKEKPYFVQTTASLDGSAVYVGMNNALVFRLGAPTWTPTDLSIPGYVQPITRFAVAAPDLLVAIAGTGMFGHDGLSWTAASTGIVGAPSFQAVDRTTDPVTLHLASADTVWRGAGPGVNVSWGLESAGLPTDLRFVTESSGASFVYLSTFGWSVFRRLLNLTRLKSRDSHFAARCPPKWV